MRSRLHARPSGVRFQHCEHNGAVRRDRTIRPHVVHGRGASGSGKPARRARQRAVRAQDESRDMVRSFYVTEWRTEAPGRRLGAP